MHFLFAYALCGVGVGLVISTIDLLYPTKVQMGVPWTLFAVAAWPLFAVVVAAYALGWRPYRD